MIRSGCRDPVQASGPVVRFARRLGRFIFFFAGGIVMAWIAARDESRDETLAERERRLRRAL